VAFKIPTHVFLSIICFSKISPTTEVVLGGFTTSSLRYLAYCNGYINHFIEDDGTIIDSTLIDDICNADFLIAGRETELLITLKR